MCEEAIAQQRAERISPTRVYGWPRPASFRFIHDVVMHERRDVDQFDNHGKIDMSSVEITGRAAGQKRKQRAQTFPAAANGVGHIAFDVGIKSCRLLHNPRFNVPEMRLHQLSHSSQWAERRSGCWTSRAPA